MKNVAIRQIFGTSSFKKCQCRVIAIAALSGLASYADGGTHHEVRRYSNPIATSSFGSIVDISSKYAAVIGWQGSNFVAKEYHAFIFDANTGQHLWTLSQPVPEDNVNFRFSSVAVDGDLAVIGATYAHVPRPGGGFAYNAGAAYVYDLKTGQLKHKLVSNTPQSNFLLGDDVDILGDRIVVGAWNNAYVFDAESGAQLAKLTPTSPSSPIGGSVALSESTILVGAGDDESQGPFTGAVYAFDAQTFQQKSKFIPADAKANDNLGFSVGIDGNTGIVSGAGGVYVFDATSGQELAKLELPGGPLTYPTLVDIQVTSAFLSNPASQQAAIYDWTTGSTLHQLVRGNVAGTSNFGYNLGVSGGKVLVGAVGRAYQFQIPEPTSVVLFVVGLLLIPRIRAGGLRFWSARWRKA
jgi:outer membrane protein assembly factor BamB